MRAWQTFDNNLGAPRLARRWLTERLETYAARPDPADLLLTELATNAVVHARTPFTVELHLDVDLRVSVADGDRVGQPVLRPLSDEGEAGRGLPLVAALSERWGVTPAPDGKVVWFEVPVEPGWSPRGESNP